MAETACRSVAGNHSSPKCPHATGLSRHVAARRSALTRMAIHAVGSDDVRDGIRPSSLWGSMPGSAALHAMAIGCNAISVM